MKAEHRHELQTNALADGLGKLVGKAKTGSGMIWGGLLLIVGLGVAYWWWTGATANRTSDAWASYWNNRDSAEAVENIAGRVKGTAAEKAAKLALADQLYGEGYQAYFRKTPQKAQEKFARAAEVYEELSKSGGAPEISLRALLGAGKSHESLGQIERARHFYDEAVTRYGKQLATPEGKSHPFVAEAQRRSKDLNERAGIAFYRGESKDRNWPQRLPGIEFDPAKSTSSDDPFAKPPDRGDPLTKPSGDPVAKPAAPGDPLAKPAGEGAPVAKPSDTPPAKPAVEAPAKPASAPPGKPSAEPPPKP